MKTKTFLALLAILFFNNALNAATYYVSNSGSNSNSGTSISAAWATIGKAATAVEPGDVVFVLDGTYNETVSLAVSGSPTAWITFKALNQGQAHIVGQAADTYDDAVEITGNYIEWNGFDVTTSSNFGHGIEILDNHHTRILNNNIHNCGGSGIQGNHMDYLTVEGNVCSFNAYNNTYDCSGISIYEARDKGINDGSQFRIIVRNNILHSNWEKNVKSRITDGNGIIIDDFLSSQNSSFPPYTHSTLVENNLCYNNGARGIHVFYTNNVVVRNNTTYKNHTDGRVQGTWKGDLHCQNADNVQWINNIVYAIGFLNDVQAILCGNSTNISYYNNIVYNGSINVSGCTNVTPIDASTGNFVNVDPLFANPTSDYLVANFHLQASSVGINGGTSQFGIPAIDLDGNSRPIGVVDIGCYESGSGSSNISPTINLTAPLNGSTFTAPANITISANAADSDGSIANVEFYAGSTLLGSNNSSPYNYTWNNVAAGAYVISAKAYDNLGASTVSGPVSITVSNQGGNQLPVCNITSPANGATFAEPATISITATATDADGTITHVEFYSGSNLLGSDNTAPYNYTWSNVAAGSYVITVKAFDNAGASASSQAINVVVNSNSGGQQVNSCGGHETDYDYEPVYTRKLQFLFYPRVSVSQVTVNISKNGDNFVPNSMLLQSNDSWEKTINVRSGENYSYSFTYVTDGISKTGPTYSYSVGQDCSGFKSANIENEGFNDVNVYPNPVHDFLNISHTSAIGEVKIFNSSGKMVKEINNKMKQEQICIDFSSFQHGVYLVQLNGNSEIKIIKCLKQ